MVFEIERASVHAARVGHSYSLSDIQLFRVRVPRDSELPAQGEQCSTKLSNWEALLRRPCIGVKKILAKVSCFLQGRVLERVTHHFYMKEYQARGAPHYHAVV